MHTIRKTDFQPQVVSNPNNLLLTLLAWLQAQGLNQIGWQTGTLTRSAFHHSSRYTWLCSVRVKDNFAVLFSFLFSVAYRGQFGEFRPLFTLSIGILGYGSIGKKGSNSCFKENIFWLMFVVFIFFFPETFHNFPPWHNYCWLSQYFFLWFCQEPWIHSWLWTEKPCHK